MGEAKRRKQTGSKPGPRWCGGADPLVQAMFENPGEPITVALIGAGLIPGSIVRIPRAELMNPQHRALRMAFSAWDRIRLGEIEGRCSICDARQNVAGLSCYAVIERAHGGPLRDKPALVLPVCHRCDSVSTEETQRRVMGLFPMAPPSLGGAA